MKITVKVQPKMPAHEEQLDAIWAALKGMPAAQLPAKTKAVMARIDAAKAAKAAK